jgi:hypothetical protein
MARQSLTPIDAGFLQLLGLRIENRTSAPPNPQPGYVYFDTTAGTYRLFQGGVWFELATSGVLVGLYAQRPAPGASGQLFWATNQSVMYVDDGVAWQVVGGGEGGGPHDHPISGVDGLQDALDAKAVDVEVVKLTGNQSVDGIKTFTSSPVVPTPTTDLQAATKKYVDDNAGAPPALGMTLWGNGEFSMVAAATRTLNATNSMIWVVVWVTEAATVTGIRYRKGAGTTAANVRVALYDVDGVRVANRTTNFAQGTTASAVLTVPFDAPVELTPGIYWLGYLGSSTSADFFGWAATNEYLGAAHNATQGAFTTPASFTPPALTAIHTATVKPWLQLY